MKNINKSFQLGLFFGFWIWVFLQIWLTCAIVAICAVAFATAYLSSAVTVTILLGTIGLSTVAKIVFEINVGGVTFFRKCERIFLNNLIDSLWAVHVIMVIFAAVTETSLKIREVLPNHTFCRLQNMYNTFLDIDSFDSCNLYTCFPFRREMKRGQFWRGRRK